MTGSSSFSSSLFRRPCGHRNDGSVRVSVRRLDCGWFPGLAETLVPAHLTPRRNQRWMRKISLHAKKPWESWKADPGVWRGWQGAGEGHSARILQRKPGQVCAPSVCWHSHHQPSAALFSDHSSLAFQSRMQVEYQRRGTVDGHLRGLLPHASALQGSEVKPRGDVAPGNQ